MDGEEAEYGAFRNAFLAVKMKPGRHYVEISFIPPGFELGLTICVVSLILTMLVLLIPTRKQSGEMAEV